MATVRSRVILVLGTEQYALDFTAAATVPGTAASALPRAPGGDAGTPHHDRRGTLAGLGEGVKENGRGSIHARRSADHGLDAGRPATRDRDQRKLARRGPALRRQGQRPFPDWLQRALEAQGYHFDSEGRIDWRATESARGKSGATDRDGPLTGGLKVDRADG